MNHRIDSPSNEEIKPPVKTIDTDRLMASPSMGSEIQRHVDAMWAPFKTAETYDDSTLPSAASNIFGAFSSAPERLVEAQPGQAGESSFYVENLDEMTNYGEDYDTLENSTMSSLNSLTDASDNGGSLEDIVGKRSYKGSHLKDLQGERFKFAFSCDNVCGEATLVVR